MKLFSPSLKWLHYVQMQINAALDSLALRNAVAVIYRPDIHIQYKGLGILS